MEAPSGDESTLTTSKPPTRRVLMWLPALLVLSAISTASGTPRPGPGGVIAVPAEVDSPVIFLVYPRSGITRRVTAPDYVLSVDLSPDRRRLAVAGTTGVWVMRLDGRGAKRIVDLRNQRFGASDVEWSPEGRRLAFVRGRTLFTASADGANIKRLVQHADSPDWTPDGRRIVFVRNPDASSGNGIVASIRTDGRALKRVVRAGKWYGPRVSPDGSRLAFYRSGSSGIFVSSAHGGPVRRLLASGSQPEWSPDGRFIAFARNTRCGHAVCEGRIFVVDANGGKARGYGPVITDIGALSWSR